MDESEILRTIPGPKTAGSLLTQPDHGPPSLATWFVTGTSPSVSKRSTSSFSAIGRRGWARQSGERAAIRWVVLGHDPSRVPINAEADQLLLVCYLSDEECESYTNSLGKAGCVVGL